MSLFAYDDRQFSLIIKVLAGRWIDDLCSGRGQRREWLEEDQWFWRHRAFAFFSMGSKITRDADNLCRRAGNEQLDGGAIYEAIIWLAPRKWITAQQVQLVVRWVKFVGLGLGSLGPMDGAFELDAIEAVLH
jgi:hypothetical protein